MCKAKFVTDVGILRSQLSHEHFRLPDATPHLIHDFAGRKNVVIGPHSRHAGLLDRGLEDEFVITAEGTAERLHHKAGGALLNCDLGAWNRANRAWSLQLVATYIDQARSHS